MLLFVFVFVFAFVFVFVFVLFHTYVARERGFQGPEIFVKIFISSSNRAPQ